jgi:hypothetical protein
VQLGDAQHTHARKQMITLADIEADRTDYGSYPLTIMIVAQKNKVVDVLRVLAVCVCVCVCVF